MVGEIKAIGERKDKNEDATNQDNQHTIQENEVKVKVTFDDVLVELGEFGRSQKIYWLMFSLPAILSSMQITGWVFVGAALPHRCRLPGEDVVINHMEWKESAREGGWEAHQCHLVQHPTPRNENPELFDSANFSIERHRSCELGWSYDRRHSQDSLVADWDLVCHRKGIFATLGAAPMGGYIPGGFVFGLLMDKIGRKSTFLIANLLMIVAGLLAALAPEVYSFFVARAIAGFAIAGIEDACFILSMELVGPSARTMAGIFCWIFETGALLATVGLGYAVRHNWRLLQALYTLPALVFLSYWWAAPESVRWLLVRGRKEEAKSIIQKVAERNGVTLPEGLIANMEETIESELEAENEAKTYTVVDLFRGPRLRVIMLVLLVCSATVDGLYYMLLLDQSELSQDNYVGFMVNALVQLPGYAFTFFVLERPAFGRKRSLFMLLMMAGGAMIIQPLLPSSQSSVKVSIALVGRFAANCVYSVLLLYSYELLPTVVRGVGLGLTAVVGRLATISAPYILLLGPLSPLIFGVAACLSGLLALLLPETLGAQLPEILEDVEEPTKPRDNQEQNQISK